MKHQIAMFRFTLANGQSIGPVPLRELWQRCCGTSDVSVGRHAESFGGHRVTYSLYAPQQLPDLEQVEKRLRRLLDERKLSASVTRLHRT